MTGPIELKKSFFVLDHKFSEHCPKDSSVISVFCQAGWRLEERIEDASFVVFTGGADVSPSLYFEENTHSHTNPNRDKVETRVYNDQLLTGKGMIGICRGGQLLNVMNGGKMRQHINGHIGCKQMVYSPLAKDTMQFFEVLEDHHQEILPDPKGEVFLRAVKDDVVEGVWYAETNSFCFQPHPEWYHQETQDVFFEYLSKYFPSIK
jgi:gamma-glutamyl-gamma-aminobutyrate hydrolase PuuD